YWLAHQDLRRKVRCTGARCRGYLPWNLVTRPKTGVGGAMTPAIRVLEKAKVAFTLHPYEHDPAAESFGLEAAEALGVDPGRMFKTLVAQGGGSNLVLALVPVAARLDLKLLAAALGVKKADMADPTAAERATGYVVGGISPLGTRKALPT